MKPLQLFIPGRFEDVQLYMGHLTALTHERSLVTLDLRRLMTRLEMRYPDLRGLLTAAFARNDWLASEQFRTLRANHGIANRWNDILSGYPDSPIDVRDADFEDIWEFDLEASVVLDMNFYSQRLYVGTDLGLYHFDIDFTRTSSGPATKRLDARCIATLAAFQSVHASCEEDGLFSSFDEFGWADLTADSFTRTAARSLRSAWLGRRLVNYVTNSTAQLFESESEFVKNAGRPSQRLITELERSNTDLNVVGEAVSRAAEVPDYRLRRISNWASTFFVNTINSGFYTVHLMRLDGAIAPTTVVRRYPRVPDERVLSIHSIDAGVVLETDFNLLLFADSEMHAFHAGEVLSVRSFPGSKRYRNFVAATLEDGVMLFSFVQ